MQQAEGAIAFPIRECPVSAPPPPPEPLVPADLATWPDHLAEVAARLRPVCPDPRTHRVEGSEE